jgi:hypothetical protein
LNPLIFLSYSSQDKLIADAICSRLENQNIRCWIAPRDVNPGADYSNQIADALERSTVMVMVFSSGSNSSRHVKSEIDRAFSLGKAIIPFRVENVEIDKGLSYYLAKTHWLDALTKPLDQHIDRLAGTIRQLAGAEPVPVSQIPPSPSAPPAASTKAPWIIAGIAAVLCAIVVVGGLLFFWLNQRKPEPARISTAPSQSATPQERPIASSSPSPATDSEWETAASDTTGSEDDQFAGTWKISEAATIAGESYGGSVQFTRTGTRYAVKWHAGGMDYSGLALAVENKMCAVFSSADFSVIYYRIRPDGTLKGRWAGSVFGADAPDAFENAFPSSRGKIEGSYTVKGKDSDGTSYQGKMKIVRTGKTFQFEWEIRGANLKGVGIRVEDILFVALGDKDKGPYGVVSYTFNGARAKGVWTLAGEEALGKEDLTK